MVSLYIHVQGGISVMFCGALYRPVCDRTGQTYSNTCYANMYGARVACQGECPCPPPPSQTRCPGSYRPVCDTHGHTHNNMCEANSAGAEVFYQVENIKHQFNN